jgi:hypothetical protein
MIDRAAYVVVEDGGGESAAFTVDDAAITWFVDEAGNRWLSFRARLTDNLTGTETPTMVVPVERVLRLIQLN